MRKTRDKPLCCIECSGAVQSARRKEVSKFDVLIDALYQSGFWGRVLVWITITWLAGLALFLFMSVYALAYAVFG